MTDRERFIPQRVGQTTTKLCNLPWLEDHDGAEQFRSFSRLTSALYHFEFYDREQIVTEAWEHVDDDPEASAVLVAELTGLLEAANYTPVTMADLDDALANESLIPLRLEVELDDYNELLIYRRGCRQDTIEIPKWMGLRSRERTITVDKRVVVYTRVKPQSWFDERKIDPSKRNLVPGHISLRQFQNVPRADIEMLLPSTQVGFRLVDSLLIGVPALASGIAVLATKALATFGLIFLLASSWLGIRDERPDIDQATLVILLGGVIALGGFLVRQWAKLKNRRLEYLKTLTEALYFRTLGAGPGVLHTLLSSAEQQEVVEVLLGYRFLLAASDGLNAGELDARVEKWLRDTGQGDIDFEVNDSITKLRRLEVIDGDPVMQARPLPTSLALLDRRWDDLFRYQPTDRGQ
ncbi:MAG: TMEM143 family protein [Acidimicrobiia bacterium]